MVQAVQRMQEYIKEHVAKPITLNMLAKAAGYSKGYANRSFKKLLGMNPFEYIRALRLSQAALVLRDHPAKIVDVAFDFVFDSHEGFTRAFSKHFGIAPRDYRQNTPPIRLFMPHGIQEYYLLKSKRERTMTENQATQTVFVQVVERGERLLLLKRGRQCTDYFTYCEEVGCDVWGVLCSVKEALSEPMGLWLPENLRVPGTSVYAQGVELPLSYSGGIPEGFECIALPPCQIMIFQGPPFADCEFERAIVELQGAIANYDPKLYGFTWEEKDAPRFQLEPLGYRGYMEGYPVRRQTS